jgi:hypothetical protein
MEKLEEKKVKKKKNVTLIILAVRRLEKIALDRPCQK